MYYNLLFFFSLLSHYKHYYLDYYICKSVNRFLKTNKQAKDKWDAFCLSLSLSLYIYFFLFFFLLMCRNMFWRRRMKNGLGVFLMLLFSEMMMILMMIMQQMYVATVIELETYVRTRAKCVCLWALPTDAIEYWRKQKDALIELFSSLTIRRCRMFLFILKLFFQSYIRHLSRK